MPILKKYILIVEDHPGAFNELAKVVSRISTAEILNAQTAEQALAKISQYHDQLELVSIDLGLPVEAGEMRSPASNGIDLLRKLLKERPTLNLAVNTGQDLTLLSGLKSSILEHKGGFIFLHKSASPDLMMQKLQVVLSGNLDYRIIKSELGNFAMKPKWVEALQLAANGHDNAEIAKKMRPDDTYHKHHDKTVDNYLKNIGMVLDIYAEDSGNFRVKVINAGREAGIIV